MSALADALLRLRLSAVRAFATFAEVLCEVITVVDKDVPNT
jgi:hypothetical protein